MSGLDLRENKINRFARTLVYVNRQFGDVAQLQKPADGKWEWAC